jgi:hypothetical protein
MKRLTLLLLTLLAAVAASGRPSPPRRRLHTIVQTGTPYQPETNLGVDLALVASDESARGIETTAARVDSWRRKGYRIFGMASLARVYDFYMKGGWKDLNGAEDPGGHEGEVQRDRFGGKFGPHEFMMLPSERLMEHKKLWARAFIRAGAEGMAFEEPDVFMDGGYNEQFKREWQAYYGEPWQPPHSSVEARVRSERLKAYLVYRSYKTLSEFSKREGGPSFRFMVPTHSLPGYMLWGITTSYWDTLSLPSVDILQAQVWTGTAKTPVLADGRLQQRLFENAFLDYSYSVNLAEALGKEVWLNLDPYEDEPGLSFDFYRSGFENTLAASLMFPRADRWEILPWPDRIYTNGRIPPLYGTEIQNVLSAMKGIGEERASRWKGTFPRTGILMSESALYEMRDPRPSNPQSLYALALPLLAEGVPVDVVPLEAAGVREYLDRFRILFLSYDFYKPLKAEVHAALARWAKERGGVLVILGGMNAYNDAPAWWGKAGCPSPTAHLLQQLGLASGKTELVPQRPREIRYLPPETQDDPYRAPLRGLFDGLHGADFVPREVSFVPDDRHPELNYLDTASPPGHATPLLRFADGTGSFTYRFVTRGLKRFRVRLDLANNYLVEGSTDQQHWTELASFGKTPAAEVRDGSNRKDLELDLTRFLPAETVFVRLRDPSPQDGWGPTLRRVTLLPEYAAGTAPPPSDPPLALRDAYAVGYTGIRGAPEVMVRGNGHPVAFSCRCGRGEVLLIGAPPALFGASRENGQRLRALYRAVCARRRLPLRTDGVLHLARGDYHVVAAVSREARLAGRFVDLLSPGLEVLTNPTVKVGAPRLLLSVERRLQRPRPDILFASHRLSDVRYGRDAAAFTVEGPERIPAAARVFLGASESASVSASRVRDGQPVAVEVRKDADRTLLLRFPNQEGKVRVTVDSSP